MVLPGGGRVGYPSPGRQKRRLRPHACRRRPCALPWRPVDVVIEIVGQVSRKPVPLLLGNVRHNGRNVSSIGGDSGRTLPCPASSTRTSAPSGRITEPCNRITPFSTWPRYVMADASIEDLDYHCSILSSPVAVLLASTPAPAPPWLLLAGDAGFPPPGQQMQRLHRYGVRIALPNAAGAVLLAPARLRCSAIAPTPRPHRPHPGRRGGEAGCHADAASGRSIFDPTPLAGVVKQVATLTQPPLRRVFTAATSAAVGAARGLRSRVKIT